MLMRGLEYLDADYTAIKKKIDADYTANQSIWQIYWTEATIDARLESGDVSLMAGVNASLPNNNRGQFYFNRVRPLCSMVSGYQRRNRKSSIVVPLENGDQQTADQWTKILLHLYKKAGIYDTISEAFYQGACVTGMNLLHVYLDWSTDPVNGEIKVDNLSYNSFFVDPYFRKPDLSDASFVWRRSYMTHSAAASLMPSRYDEIMALPGNPTGTGRDGRFQYAPQQYGQTLQNLVAYDEYYYRDYRKQKLLIDKITGEVFEVTNQENIDIEAFLGDNPSVYLEEQYVPTVRLAIMIQDKVFFDGSSGLDVFPFVPVIGYYNPMLPYFYSRIQGLCRSMRDPQMLLNRRIILSANILESVVNTGFIFKAGAVLDVKHLYQTGEGKMIPIKDEYQLSEAIQPIVPPQIPPSIFQLQDTFSQEINLVTGINEELMGFNYDDKSGIRSALQQGAGLTTLQPLFDRLDNAQNLLSTIIMQLVRANYTPGKIKNILGGEEPAPLFYNKAFGKYHCDVQLGFNTETQRQMQFAQLLQLRELGLEIPAKTLINAATLQNKEDLIQDIQAMQEQQMQAQQAQSQFAMQEQQARTELAQARAEADRGLAVERVSRVQENQALADERRSEAIKDDYQALLNFTKALKELENIDLNQLQTIIALQKMLSDQQINKQDIVRGSTLRENPQLL